MQVLGRQRATIEHELLELAERRVEQRAARRLVDAARLHADQAIFDDVDAADTVPAADPLSVGEQLDAPELSPFTETGVPARSRS